ncbi:hypothetical protein Tco_1117172 [Tanacetum coccineum]
MVEKEAKSTTRKIVTNDQANYYLGITSITVNGKNAYELKGKFLDDLHKNAFSGTNGEDAREDGYCNRGNLPGAYIVGNTLRYQDLEWYDALKDSGLKEEALKNKAIMEGMIDDNYESIDDRWKIWDGYEITNHD